MTESSPTLIMNLFLFCQYCSQRPTFILKHSVQFITYMCIVPVDGWMDDVIDVILPKFRLTYSQFSFQPI